MGCRRSARAATQWGALAALLAIVTGCASTAGAPEPTRLVWPPPPQPARIEFVRTISSDKSLQRDSTFSERVAAFLTGVKPPANRIAEPMGIAVSDDGQRLYVSDFAQLQVFVFDFARNKFTALGEQERLAHPVGIALDGQERLYVVEQEKKGVSIFDRNGRRLGFITHPNLERPTGIAIDRARGKIYVADAGHTKSERHTVKVFNMNGELVATIGGTKGSGPGHFMFPTYLAVDPQGDLYVTDTLNSRVQVFDPDGRYLKSFGQRGTSWGMFDKPKGVALDSFGNVYVADSGWSNVQIFNQKGQVLLFFGGRGPLPGMLRNPTAVAIDRTNHIYVADYMNHRVEIYRLVNTTANDSFLDPTARNEGGEPAPNETNEVSRAAEHK